MNTEQYIASLPLTLPEAPFPRQRVTRVANAHQPQSADGRAFMADKSLVSFAAGVGHQARTDVLNCTLLAQLAANKAAPDEDQRLDWYRAFSDVLTKLGWILEERDAATYEAAETMVHLEDVIIDILTAAFGSTYLALIRKTLEAIKNAGDSKKITAFERNTQAVSKGFFQMALASEVDGAVSIGFGTFLLTSSITEQKVLFADFSKDKTRLEYISRRATFNPAVFAPSRRAVQEKLGALVSDYVAEIEI